MSENIDNLTMSADQDLWSPAFTGVKLTQLKSEWMARSNALNAPRLAGKTQSRRFHNISPIRNIALVGALRSHQDGRLNIRDELTCRAIMREVIPHIPLSNDCAVDLYDLAENKDIFSSNKKYDMIIFCNIRSITLSINNHYRKMAKNGKLPVILQKNRQPQLRYGHDIDRALADTLLPSEILSGIKFTGIAPEHTYYVTVSEQALQKPDAYTDLIKRLNCRFVATWGFVGYLDGSDFSTPSSYDLSRSPGQRLLKRDSFTLTQQDHCVLKLMQPYISQTKACMPDFPHIDFAVRNDELEAIATQEDAINTPLFGGGVERLQKMELLASTNQTRCGRRPIGKSDRADRETMASLRDKLARPLNWAEKTERFIRRSFS